MDIILLYLSYELQWSGVLIKKLHFDGGGCDFFTVCQYWTLPIHIKEQGLIEQSVSFCLKCQPLGELLGVWGYVACWCLLLFCHGFQHLIKWKTATLLGLVENMLHILYRSGRFSMASCLRWWLVKVNACKWFQCLGCWINCFSSLENKVQFLFGGQKKIKLLKFKSTIFSAFFLFRKETRNDFNKSIFLF